jgi:hypothetical protein
MAILTDPRRYAANHGGAAFKRPAHLLLYDKNIADNATTIVHVCAESAHCARLDDYASYEAAKRGATKFLCKVVDKVWYNDLKNADTLYTKVLALKIMAFLGANSGGLHAVDMITLHTNMHGYYMQVDSIPQYIIMLEEAQKKAKRAGVPIVDIKLVMMASAAVLVVQHFPRKVDNWEGLPANSRSWAAWKMAFLLAHLKHQHQILASGGGSLAVGLTVCFLRRGRRSSGLKQHSTIWRLWPPTTRPCFSSSRLPTWPSWPPLVLSLRPTRNWWMQRLVQGNPLLGLQWEGHGRQKLPSLATIVGHMAIASARITQVQPAPTEPLATVLTPLLGIPWEAARRTRVGAWRAT